MSKEESSSRQKIMWWLYWGGITIFNISVWHDTIIDFFTWVITGEIVTKTLSVVQTIIGAITWFVDVVVPSTAQGVGASVGAIMISISLILSYIWGERIW